MAKLTPFGNQKLAPLTVIKSQKPRPSRDPAKGKSIPMF